jgi:hypothetical protein
MRTFPSTSLEERREMALEDERSSQRDIDTARTDLIRALEQHQRDSMAVLALDAAIRARVAA